MSIIYDALKKIEVSTDINSTVKIDTTNKPRNKSKYKIYLVYILVVCTGFLITGMFLGIFTKPLKTFDTNLISKNLPRVENIEKLNSPQLLSQDKILSDVNIPVSNQPKIEPKYSFILNGVFFSYDEGYALINNQIVKKGDVIDGATVVRIDLDEVTLEAKDSSTIKLSNRK